LSIFTVSYVSELIQKEALDRIENKKRRRRPIQL
jgi:hypothetical protein